MYPVNSCLVRISDYFSLSVIVCFVAGLALSLLVCFGWVPWIAGSASAALLSVLLLRRHCGIPTFLVLVLFACVGLFIGSVRLKMLKTGFMESLAGKRVEADVTVISPPEAKGRKLVFMGRVTGVSWQGKSMRPDEDALVEIACRDRCAGPMASMDEGAMLRGEMGISRPLAMPDADFDYSQYLQRRGINSTLRGQIENIELLPSRRGGLNGLVDRLRTYSRHSLRSGDWGGAGSLLQGMVLGDDHVVPDEIIDDFRDAGLLHMLAVSGQNVVLLGFIILLLLRALMVPKLAATFIAALVICLYVPLTGSGPSIVRAGVVGVLGLAALLFSRQTDRYHFLALAAALILSLNPYSLLDPGFQLSFAAVLAIFFIAPVFSQMLGFMPPALREAVAISTATGLATAPITLANFHQVSLVTVPANVAAAPVAGPVMMLGVLAILSRPLLPLLCWTLVAAASVCTGYLIVVARVFASFPSAVYNGSSPGLLAVSAFYCMLAGMVVLVKRKSPAGAIDWIKTRRGITVPLLLLLALIVGLACFSGGSGALPPDSFTVSFLDVGQGDAGLIQVPPSESSPAGYTVLIDGGPGSSVVERLDECGVTRLDAVFLTHPDADHLSGLLPVLNQYPVAAVFDAAPPSSSPMYRDFLSLVEKKKISYNVARKGQLLAFGDLGLEVLGPGDSLRADDANANSIVLLAGYRGLDILFPGDAEGEVLMNLNLTPVEILKVSHHGSRDNNIEQVLRRVEPGTAVISVGKGNSYGHPAKQTLDALTEAGTSIYRTDEQGTVRISYAAGGMEISTQK